MKFVQIFFFFFFSFSLVFAQSDECRPYVPVAVGTTWEMTYYNAKGKTEGVTSFELVDLQEDGSTTTFTITTKSMDKDGELVYEHTYEAYCTDGNFQVNMEQFMDGSALQAYENMEVTIDASDYELPDLDAPAGTQLPDGTLNVSVDTGTPININMSVLMTDREISARESITTPVGEFDCLVMRQTVRTKMMVKTESSSKDWYAEEVGVVRSETYNRKGKLTGYSELTKLVLP